MQMIARIAVGCAGASRVGEAVTSRGAGTGELLRSVAGPRRAVDDQATAFWVGQGVPVVTGTGRTPQAVQTAWGVLAVPVSTGPVTGVVFRVAWFPTG